ncbi:MAG: protein phosphatase 2C domain-containing protein [Cyanobacteria bacterium M_surface_10_m2_179]|nr:protein phosphatase 2C domain-containing protein [Cyanobacteria bacterium M_surface_10_m2_179]
MVSHPWLPGQAYSVIGAAHRRQGKPCQDASLCSQLQVGDALLQLLVVADGHGGHRYGLSDAGSAIACAQAEQAVRELSELHPLTDRGTWLELLRHTLPSRIHTGWLAAIEGDWQQRPEAEREPFTPLSYGCTLGLVLLAPQWWGCSGIGDWDLTAVAADGSAQLLSEELGASGSSEATGSLCQPWPEQAWAGRAQLQPLNNGSPRALVLSTDGVRKSCATDADYLNLCSALIELSGAELADGLEQITSEGSGDDVSVAIALAVGAAPPAQGRAGRPRRWLLGGVLGLALASAAGLAGWRWLQPPDPLAQLISELCQQPQRIRPTLLQRRSQFAALVKQPSMAVHLQAQASTDPLGALIAGANSRSGLSCRALQLGLQQQWQQARAAARPANAKMPATAPSSP